MPPSRTAEIGAIRVARTAGQTEATSVTSVPVSIATTAVRGRKTVADCGISSSTGLEERGQPLREQDAEAEPDRGGDEAEHRALEHDRAEHLAARGAERPQCRELLRPLRDRDRERVEDDERADEERDPAEGEQEVADEGDELADALAVLRRLLGAGLHLGRVGQRGGDRVDQLALADAVAGRRRRPRRTRPCRARCAPWRRRRARSWRRRGCRRRRSGRSRSARNARTGPSPATLTVSPTLEALLVGGAHVDRRPAAGRRPSRPRRA